LGPRDAPPVAQKFHQLGLGEVGNLIDPQVGSLLSAGQGEMGPAKKRVLTTINCYAGELS
jgi:hypothetical protein